MKLNTFAISIIATIALLTATSPALSADNYQLPAEVMQGEIRYITGGIGLDEAAAFKQAAGRYGMELQFVQKASPMDEFLSDVQVIVRTRSGTVVLDTTSQGPYLLANMPAGRYNIEVNHKGMIKRHAVDMRAGKHERAVFVWPTDADPENRIQRRTAN